MRMKNYRTASSRSFGKLTGRIFPSQLGFTLVELMTAMALATTLTIGIMSISQTANDIYKGTTSKVEQTSRFKIALITMDRDFSQWLPTANLEYYMDGTGPGSRANLQWDESEELKDKSDAIGPGVVDGGVYEQYDEFASLTQINYEIMTAGNNEGRVEGEPEPVKHSADQLYFRSYTFVDGAYREANIEYKLVDPTKPKDPTSGQLQSPIKLKASEAPNLTLIKVIRYHKFDTEDIYKTTQEFEIVRKQVEVVSNVTDFKVEYATRNRFIGLNGIEFYDPKKDFNNPLENEIRPKRINLPGGLEGYRKKFGYGSNDIQIQYARATAFKAHQGDRSNVQQHRPFRFGFERNPNIQFAQLAQGDRIFAFTSANRGVQSGGAGRAGQGTFQTGTFPSGLYTIKNNLGGQLEFYEDIDTAQWDGNVSSLFYKAAFVPQALRITLRVVDDKGKNPRTFQRVVWIRKRAG